jgi:hypothetical protein
MMSSRSKLAIALTVALLATTVYLCVYIFQQSISMLNTYREYAERLEVTQALTVLATSVLYLLFATITLLIVGILLYLLITALYRIFD